MLQSVAECCRVLQSVAVCCCVPAYLPRGCGSEYVEAADCLHCVAVCCSLLQCVAVCCSVLLHVAVWQHTCCVNEVENMSRLQITFSAEDILKSGDDNFATFGRVEL